MSALQFMRLLWKNHRHRAQAQPKKHKDKGRFTLYPKGLCTSSLSGTAQKENRIVKQDKKSKNVLGKNESVA